MKYPKAWKAALLVSILIFTCKLSSQDSLRVETARDTSLVDTILIRAPQRKITSIPRGVSLTNPVISFGQTLPLLEPFHRFKVPSFWTRENSLGLDLSEVAFVNWNAGGDNSVSALGKLKLLRNYKFRYIQWNNDLEMRFGWNAQEGRQWRKTEDVIRLSSTFSYRRDTLTNWYYTVRANFNTQFADGFTYPDRSTPVSRFMAPGYVFLGAGASYISEGGNLNLYLSPLTQKTTFVLDQELADKGAFGVERAVRGENDVILNNGKQHFEEFGFLLTNSWQTVLVKNVGLSHRVSFYSDYLKEFGNVDVDWELMFDLTVNEFIKARIGSHVLYDDDILFEEQLTEDGRVLDPGEPRIQLKQLLSLGISYSF